MAAKKDSKTKETVVRIPPPNHGYIQVKVGNKAPDGHLPSLIVHRLDEKTKTQLEERDQNKKGSRTKMRPARNPKAEFEGALYRMPGKKRVYGLPASGFKKAMVRASKDIEGLHMTDMNRHVFVLEDGGGFVQLKGSAPVMREDIVRIGKGQSKVPQVRYRPEFKEWSATLRIRYDADIYAPEEILNLLARAGSSVGWGELRPEKGYDHGMWIIQGKAKVTQCAA